MVLAVFPAEEAIDDLQDLQLQRLFERIERNDLVVRQDESEPLQRLFLDFERARELLLGQHAALHQDVPEARLQSMTGGVGADHFAVEERDGDRVVFSAEGQDAGFSLQADQLKNIGQTEIS